MSTKHLPVSEVRPFVSIITLNYNQSAVTVDFLESSKKLRYPHYEILVCDMASGDNPSSIIKPDKFPNTRLLLSDKNLGFAGGNNWGMDHAKGDYYFIVNNDTILTENILDELLAPFEKNLSIGVTCPKILYYSNPDTIQYAGFYPMNPFTARTTTIGIMEKDKGQYDIPGSTAGAHGCAMMVKKAIIEKTGRFPELFFLYYEEWDWSARILKAGYTIWYTPSARILHKESISVGKSNPMKVYYHTRNRILYVRRNCKKLELYIFLLFFLFFSIPKSVLLFTLKGQFVQLRNFVKGVLWNFTHSSDSKL